MKGPKSKSAAILFAFALILGPGLTACEEEGPAERAGEQVDEAAEEAGDKVEEATD